VTKYIIDPYNHTGYAQVLRQVVDTDANTAYILGLDVLARARNGDMKYLLYDGHGSVRHLANTAGNITASYNYDAYGRALNFSPANAATSLLHAGEMYDQQTQQYYLRARWYSPLTGRFNRLDPFAGNNRDPQSLHKYLYAHANPVNRIDPSGKFLSCVCLTSAWFAIATISTILVGILAYVVGMPFYHRSLRPRTYSGKCGKDVTNALKKIYDDVTNYDKGDKSSKCKVFNLYTPIGWEIVDLHHVNWRLRGTDECRATVKVSGNCYSMHEVNYFLWGAANKACGYKLSTAKFSAWLWSIYAAPIGAVLSGQRLEGRSASKINFTEVGYKNQFSLLEPELSQFNSCDCSSSQPHESFGDNYHWGDITISEFFDYAF